MSEPTTEAGRRELADPYDPCAFYPADRDGDEHLNRIAAIESEAREQGEKAAFEEVFPLELRKARADLARRIEARVKDEADAAHLIIGEADFMMAVEVVIDAIREEAAK